MEQLKIENQDLLIVKKAFLIEDDLLHQKIMTYYLQELSYQVDLISNSSVAAQKMDSQMYNLIIVDINLYGHLPGKELIQIARQSKLNIGSPIIVWSAYVNREDDDIYRHWGADTALKKACGRKGLESAIEKCSLTPRCEREFDYKLKILQKKLQQKGPSDWVKKIHDLRQMIKEYQQWSNFHAIEGKYSS